MSMSSLKIRGGEVFLVALPIRRPHHWVGHTARLGEGYVVLRIWNHDVLQSTDEIVDYIIRIATERAARLKD